MVENTQEVTAEEVARHMSACMDSVALIQAGQQEGQTDEEWADCLERNQAHLRIMIEKDFMQDQDLAPLQAVL
jgi:hypothetical protein